jgi:uncharacterized protein (TIGR03437 family)
VLGHANSDRIRTTHRVQALNLLVQQRQPGQKQFQHRQLRRLRRAAQRIGQFRPAAPQPLIAQLRQLLRVGFPLRQRRPGCAGRVSLADGSVRTIGVTAVVAADDAVGSASGGSKERQANGCRPAQLAPQLTTLENNFSVTAQQPVSLPVKLADDCGAPVRSGQVYVGFSNGDGRLSLRHEQGGEWSGTWAPQGVSSFVRLTITALSGAGGTVAGLWGGQDLLGSVRSRAAGSGAAAGVVVNSASFQGEGRIAPGSWVSIFGEDLGRGAVLNANVPYPRELAGTRVVVNEQAMPLHYVSDNQINALIPFGVVTNAVQQVVVERVRTLSVPVEVTVAGAQPGIYMIEQSGLGYGAIVIANDGALAAPVGRYPGIATRPVRAGEFLTIYCAGLGAVENQPQAGELSPSDPLAATLAAPAVTIGGIPARVTFSGLAPGYVGLYQVNAEVPEGLPESDSVGVVLTMNNLESNRVQIAVEGAVR